MRFRRNPLLLLPRLLQAVLYIRDGVPYIPPGPPDGAPLHSSTAGGSSSSSDGGLSGGAVAGIAAGCAAAALLAAAAALFVARRKRGRHRQSPASKAASDDQLPFSRVAVVPGSLEDNSRGSHGSAARPESSSARPLPASSSRGSLATAPAAPILASGKLSGNVLARLQRAGSSRRSIGSSEAISAMLPALEGKAAEAAAKVPGLAPWAAQFLAENTQVWEEVRRLAGWVQLSSCQEAVFCPRSNACVCCCRPSAMSHRFHQLQPWSHVSWCRRLWCRRARFRLCWVQMGSRFLWASLQCLLRLPRLLCMLRFACPSRPFRACTAAVAAAFLGSDAIHLITL